MLVDLLVEEFGLERELLRPDAVVADLDLDSLSLAELAVTVTERTGRRTDDLRVPPGMTLGELAAAFEGAPVA
ncbi:phosphopantetheine-binding protein [Streptomyces sp. NPDC046887]|uniref:phosphopantetheine-binding protein n=1 Tax=Streptomyces sp. NPDC046887 TaxID=3155472 RepID=UPI0033FA8A07